MIGKMVRFISRRIAVAWLDLASRESFRDSYDVPETQEALSSMLAWCRMMNQKYPFKIHYIFHFEALYDPTERSFR